MRATVLLIDVKSMRPCLRALLRHNRAFDVESFGIFLHKHPMIQLTVRRIRVIFHRPTQRSTPGAMTW